MESEKSIEYIGYNKLYNFFRKQSRRLANLAEKIQFEQYKMIFSERDDDIYVATYPKSGTTLMQVILYQLTTKSDMSFKHIYDVSPWIRNASFKNQKPLDLPSPRIIKTHDTYKDFSKGLKGRFIFVYRNGMDVAVSHYHQHKNYNKSNLQFEEYLKDFYKTEGWFKYCKAWLENKRKFPILFVRYEDLLNNKRSEIERIIAFLNLKVNEKAIDMAIEYSSFEYMKNNESKFGDQPVEDKKVFDQFIRKGTSGEGKQMFTMELELKFHEKYNQYLKKCEEKAFTNVSE